MMIPQLDDEDDTQGHHVLVTLYGDNIEPIHVCADYPVEYEGVEYLHCPFALHDEETHFSLELHPLLENHLHYVSSPRIDLLLIGCPDHDRVIAKLTNLTLIYDNQFQIFKGN